MAPHKVRLRRYLFVSVYLDVSAEIKISAMVFPQVERVQFTLSKLTYVCAHSSNLMRKHACLQMRQPPQSTLSTASSCSPKRRGTASSQAMGRAGREGWAPWRGRQSTSLRRRRAGRVGVFESVCVCASMASGKQQLSFFKHASLHFKCLSSPLTLMHSCLYAHADKALLELWALDTTDMGTTLAQPRPYTAPSVMRAATHR